MLLRTPALIAVFFVSFVVGNLSPTLHAQEDHTSDYDTYTPRELTIHHYAPLQFSAYDLLQVSASIFGRRLVVVDGSNERAVENMFILGSSIVVYDTPDNSELILQGLRELEGGEPAPAEVEPEYVTEMIRVQHIPFASLERVLSPFRRNLIITGRGINTQVNNISVDMGTGVVVLHDEPERIAAMKNVIAQVDVPTPQVMLTCLLVRPADSADPRVPADLAADLTPLIGAGGLQLVSRSMVRTSVSSGRMLTMELSSEGERHQLEMMPTAYDAERGSMTLEHCTLAHALITNGFQGYRQLFATSTSVSGGQYTVLGASGSPMTFAVLRIDPVD